MFASKGVDLLREMKRTTILPGYNVNRF